MFGLPLLLGQTFPEDLQGQIESLTRLRKEFVRVGNQIEAAEAAQALAQLRKLTDFKPPVEKKKLFVEAVVADKPAMIKPMHLKATRLKEYDDQEKAAGCVCRTH